MRGLISRGGPLKRSHPSVLVRFVGIRPELPSTSSKAEHDSVMRLVRYAVIVFHDENDNGLLDENAMGVPVEGYGFSNDAQGFLSAPSFNAAAITLPPSDEIIDASISLIYPRAPSSADKEDFDQFMGSSEAPNYPR
jgi:hypothetical protein